MRRKVYNKRADRGMFRTTAVKSKKINTSPTVYRGGIRL